MDSVQFKNIGVGVNEINSPKINDRNQNSAVTNPAVSKTTVPEYKPAAYTSAVTMRTHLATKDEKKKYKELMEELVEPKYKRKLEYALKSGKLLKNNSNDKSTVLDNLYKIIKEDRDPGLNKNTILEECLDILANPYVITQTCEDIPKEYQKSVIGLITNLDTNPNKILQTKWELDNMHTGTCPAASIEFDLATKHTAEFFRLVEGLTSPKHEVTKRIKLDSLSENNNSEKRICDGISLTIKVDEEYLKIIDETLRKENSVFPFEYYKCIFKKFSNDPYNNYKKPIRHIIIDESNLSNEYYVKDYISNLYSSYANELIKNNLDHEFRKIKKEFEDNSLKEINEKIPDIRFGLTTNSKYSLENNLTLYEQGINIWNKGAGSICMLKIKTSITKQSENIDLVLIEEPENHLSDINMKKMINSIINSTQKQTFITTHNSMICSRLDLRKIIALHENNIITTKFKDISEDTAKFFIKCPSNSILSFILSEKSILVEGTAEYILLEKFYEIENKTDPSSDGVNIISVNNLGFKRYLEVAQKLNKKVVVITDNDGCYKNNIEENYKDYITIDNIKVFSDEDDKKYTFEVCVYNDNIEYITEHRITKETNQLSYMLNNKAESAYRLLEHLEKNTENFKVPKYIKDAITWIKN